MQDLSVEVLVGNSFQDLIPSVGFDGQADSLCIDIMLP